jgi:hypothetical protein
VLYTHSPRLIGFTASSHPELFPSPSFFDFNLYVVPSKSKRSRIHPLVVRLSRVPSSQLLAQSLSTRASPCLGFCPLRDITRTQPLFASAPTPSLRYVLRLSQPLDVFLRARACRPISSRSHVQGPRPFRGLLSSRSHPSSSEGATPSPLSRAPLTNTTGCPIAPVATECGPRPRGLHPREAAFTEPPLFTTTRAAPLIEFVSSRHSRVRLIAPYLRSPLSTLLVPAFALAIANTARPQRLSRTRMTNPSPFRLPARAFEPSLRPSVRRDDPRRLSPANSIIPRQSHQPGCPRGDPGATRSDELAIARAAELHHLFGCPRDDFCSTHSSRLATG